MPPGRSSSDRHPSVKMIHHGDHSNDGYRQHEHQSTSRTRHKSSTRGLPDAQLRRRSVPSELVRDDHQRQGGSNRSPIRDRRRKDIDIDAAPTGQGAKIEQVFFPPFEEASMSASGLTSALSEMSGMIVDDNVEVDVDGERTWKSLLSPERNLPLAGGPDRSGRPVTSVRLLNHRRTQSSTDISTLTARTPLRPTGFSLNKMAHPSPGPNSTLSSSSSPSSPPSSASKSRPTSSISPLTRSARRMLGDTDENGLDSPTEECPGGRGLLEAIRLDSLYKPVSVRGEGSGRALQEDQKVHTMQYIHPISVLTGRPGSNRLAKFELSLSLLTVPTSTVQYAAGREEQEKSALGRYERDEQ